MIASDVCTQNTGEKLTRANRNSSIERVHSLRSLGRKMVMTASGVFMSANAAPRCIGVPNMVVYQTLSCAYARQSSSLCQAAP